MPDDGLVDPGSRGEGTRRCLWLDIIPCTSLQTRTLQCSARLAGDSPDMATQPPSVQSLQNWEDAFIHYPLPTVRALERDLRRNIDENRSKLRSLVGASYRDLLGTAEKIIEMDGQMHVLEAGLGEMGRRCDARVLERSGRDWAEMKKRRGDGGGEDGMAVMAQTKVLRGCLTVVGRVVKAGGDALLGAKVLVLARLLIKSIGESGKAPPVLDELRKKLSLLRKRLLAYFERCLTKTEMDKTMLAGTLCAFALVTSSTPKDVLRNFLQVRFRQLEMKTDSPSESEVMEMLDLYSRTLLDTKDLFPRRFADALSQLSKTPLLRDHQVHSSHELSLDIYGQWISADVRAFTPWVRHDQVTSGEAGDALASWTKQAHQCLLTGLEEHLEQQTDLSLLVDSRHAVLLQFMAVSSRLRSENHASAIDNIRTAFLRRMQSLITTSAQLPDIKCERAESAALPISRHDSLWDLAREDIDLSAGADAFRHAVIRRHNGRDAPIDAEIGKLDAWVKSIEQTLDSIDRTRSRKWDDDLDFDIEDLDEGDALLESLSKRDPEDSTKSLRDSVETTLKDISTQVEALSATTASPAYLLRLWREVHMRVIGLQGRLAFTPALVSLQALHRNLAVSVSEQPIENYVGASKSVSHVATSLWDGTPALPVQPTPAAFKLLTSLHRAMSEAGDDLWSSACALELRKVVGEKLAQGLSTVTSSQSDAALTNGHADSDEDDASTGREAAKSTKHRLSLQALFDQLFLQQVFAVNADTGDTSSIAATIDELIKQTEIDAIAQQRMRKAANDYWKRTYLLFGLLATKARD